MSRNKLGDTFAKSLQGALSYDKYVKSIDVAGNRIGPAGLKSLIKGALLENNSILVFDARLNPGCSEKVERQLALCMLKNIEKMRQKELQINPEFLKPDLYSFQIPPHILKGLGLLAPGEKPKRVASRTSKRSSVVHSRQANTPMTASMLGPSGTAFDAYNTGQINLIANESYDGKRIHVKRSQHQIESLTNPSQTSQIMITNSKQVRPHSSNQFPIKAKEMPTPSTADQSKARNRSSAKRGKPGHSEIRVVGSK